MSGWNEDNFLEQIAPLLGPKSRAGTCPDAQTLDAVLEGAASPAVRDAVAAHTAGCPACTELERRLHLFASGTVPETDNAWRQTEKRLDSRLQVFLGNGAAPARQDSWWNLRSWKMMWLLAPAAALGIATFMVRVHPAPRNVPVQTAAGATAPPFVIADKPAAGIPATMSAAKVVETPPSESNPVPAVPSEARPQPEPEDAAQAPSNPDTFVRAEPPPTHLSMRRAAGLVPVAGQAPGRAAAPADSVRINAGTRVWILLKSTSPQTNGDFRFRGIVLLPVTQAGAVLLDRETEVVGVGKVSQGRTTIRIVEFAWQGERYKLRGATGAVTATGPGAGPTVEFNAGQVLETWLAAVSTYERVSGEAAPPQE
jgi:hypothetical protein